MITKGRNPVFNFSLQGVFKTGGFARQASYFS